VKDFEGFAKWLVELGARRLSPEVVSEAGTASRWIVMADPEGNEFCMVSDRAAG
jgi:hypothetical protein